MIARLCIAPLLVCAAVVAQTPTPAAPPAHPAFEVVSIHPSKPGSNIVVSMRTSPDGYRVTAQPLTATILMAYFPQGIDYWKDRLQNSPSWSNDLYDIDARVSQADLAQWQKESGLPPDQRTLFPQMLQSMLADRFKLVVHRVPTTMPGFALQAGKHGPKMTESDPAAPLPQGLHLPGGGVMVRSKRGEPVRIHFYNLTMADFAQRLSGFSGGRPVQDKTGLTGHYDFVLAWQDVDPDHPGSEGVISSDDPDPLSHWDLDSVGLRVEPVKLPGDAVVIDHIEKPSEN